LSLSVTVPAQRARAAITARLANSSNGFNPVLRACIAAGDPATKDKPAPFAIDFSNDSPNFLHGKYDIIRLFEGSEITLPAIAVYQAPVRGASPRQSLIGSMFSGTVSFGLDVHMCSTEGQSQTVFDRLVSVVHDAVISTFNQQGATEYGKHQLVWGQEIVMEQPTRILDEASGQYLSTLPFLLNFYSAV
jgi:hypothetical protein